jgi:hypothetical protein
MVLKLFQNSISILFILFIAIGPFTPKKVHAENKKSKYQLYDIKKSLNSYLYVIETEVVKGKTIHRWVPAGDENHEKWGIYLGEHDLVYGEEVEDVNGHRYLRVPYQKKNGDQNEADEASPYFVIPEYRNNKPVDKDQVNQENYMRALPGEKRAGGYLTNREDNIVYLDMPYHDLLPLTPEPGTDTSKCTEGLVSLKCLGWPSSQEKLKILESRPILKRDPETGKTKMELQYLVETEYKRKTCGVNDDMDDEEKSHYCPEKKFKIKGWIPAHRTIDFKKEDTFPGEDIFAYTDEELRQFEMAQKRLKDQNCDFKKSMIPGLEDLHLVLDEAMRFPFKKDDIGACTDEAKKHIGKMRATINLIEEQYSGYIEAEEKKKKPDYNKIAEWELTKQKKALSKLSDLWPTNKTPFDVFVRSHWDEKYAKPGQSHFLNKDQMISVDALARTLYGEMRESGCSSRTSSYYKEITRVMFNRAALIKKRGGTIEKFISSASIAKIGNVKDASVFEILPHVISAPFQISSWNSNDNNLMVNLCPNPKSAEEKAAWKLAKAVAIESVINKDKFLDETKEVQSVFYASKIKPMWEDDPRFSRFGLINVKHQLVNTHTKNVEVFNTPVNNPECVKLYKDSDYSKDLREMHGKPEQYYSRLFLDFINFPNQYREILIGMEFDQ